MDPVDYRRLSDAARGVVLNAIEQARALHHHEVAAAHLLLALRAGTDDRVVVALQNAGMRSLEQAREALAARLPRAELAGDLPVASEVRAVLSAATKGRDDVAPAALCEALLATDNTATRLLEVLGVDRAMVRAGLCGTGIGDAVSHGLSDQSLARQVQRALEHAERLATGVGRVADDGDLAVALISERGSPLGEALAVLGITREQLEEALADTRPRASRSD